MTVDGGIVELTDGIGTPVESTIELLPVGRKPVEFADTGGTTDETPVDKTPMLSGKLMFPDGDGMFEDGAENPVDKFIVELDGGVGIDIDPVPVIILELVDTTGTEDDPVPKSELEAIPMVKLPLNEGGGIEIEAVEFTDG